MSTSSRKTLSKHKAKNCKKSSRTKKFKKTLAHNPSKCKAENSEESSPSKKFKKNFITKSVKTQSRELGGVIAIKEV